MAAATLVTVQGMDLQTLASLRHPELGTSGREHRKSIPVLLA